MVGDGEPGDPVVGGVEEHRGAGVGGFNTEADGEVGLPDAGWAEQDHVLGLGDEGAGGEVGEDVAAQAGEVVEVEVLQGLHGREVGGADPHDRSGGFPVGGLALQDRGQVFLMRPVFVAGLGSQWFPVGCQKPAWACELG